jgi:hypothetical protein
VTPEVGLAEIDARYPGPALEFDDRFVLILGRRCPEPRLRD